MKTLKLVSAGLFLCLVFVMNDSNASVSAVPGCGHITYIHVHSFHHYESNMNNRSSFAGYDGGIMRRHHRFSYKHIRISHPKKWNQ